MSTKRLQLTLPPAMRRCTRTSNCLERLNAKVKRRAKVIGVFPSKGSLIRLVGTYLIEENDRWAAKSKQYWLPAVEGL
ncbi:transposase [Atopobium sp. oral taxon 416]|uniref:transposase n=1 Tax=Atopobium sp. oral taxon 416 TaxID=712157 RepID=UPI0035305287